MSVAIREDRTDDEEAIGRVTEAAFTDHPHSEGTEPAIVARLRADGDLSLSLVAEDAGDIVGHVAFSPARLSDGSEGWMTLGPISVAPARQGEGIGRMLVEKGEKRLRAAGAKGIVLLGDPALYSTFGFKQNTAIRLDGPLSQYLQVLPFSENIPAASVSFAPAFGLTRLKDPEGRDPT